MNFNAIAVVSAILLAGCLPRPTSPDTLTSAYIQPPTGSLAASPGVGRERVSAINAHDGWYASAFFGGDPELDVGSPERGTNWGDLLNEAGPIACPGAACPSESWRQVVEQGRSLPLRERVFLVNDFVTRFEYREDPQHEQGEDDWKTPTRFDDLGWGDCEDYATAQYFLLRAMGTPARSLRLVRTNESAPLDHIALAVMFTDQIVVLDYDGIWEPGRYGPLVASMNEDRVWAHRNPFATDPEQEIGAQAVAGN